VSLHARLGVAVVIVAAVGALLVLVARRRPDMVPTVRVFVRLCGALAALQGLIGVVLLAIGERPAEGIHLFYGAATVIPIPLAELYAKRFPASNETMLLLYGAAATALFGLRAATTGNT
jgi:asparagine N-glycosylation enzyme membrane subunit Stt3